MAVEDLGGAIDDRGLAEMRADLVEIPPRPPALIALAGIASCS